MNCFNIARVITDVIAVPFDKDVKLVPKPFTILEFTVVETVPVNAEPSTNPVLTIVVPLEVISSSIKSTNPDGKLIMI